LFGLFGLFVCLVCLFVCLFFLTDRDAWILNVLSILFEVMEATLAFQLPNFKECWWDSLLMDIGISPFPVFFFFFHFPLMELLS
jgi:hypothetical protein